MRSRRGLAGLAAAALLTVPFVAYGGNRSRDVSILDGRVQAVSFDQVRDAVVRLYREHPAVRSFVVRDVEYSPRTRDKVLRVCKDGGAESTPGTLETSKLFACAPLIFFYYAYGRQASVPDAVELSRQLYDYAVTQVDGPYAAANVLTNLLRRWGVR